MTVYILTLMFFPALWASVRPGRCLHGFDLMTILPLRGILALMIVLHHLSQMYYDPMLHGFNYIGAYVVAAFFFITGYGLAHSLMAKGRGYLIGFMHRRLGKILPEFIILTLIMCIVSVALDGKSWAYLLERMSRGHTPLPHSWFIYAVTYVYIAFYISAWLMSGNVVRTGIVLGSFIFLYMVAARWVFAFGGWWYSSIPSAILGYYIAAYEQRLTPLVFSKAGLWVIFLCCCVIMWFGSNIHALDYMCFAMIVYICLRMFRLPSWRPLLWLGEMSLNIYLIHGIFLMLSQRIIVSPYIAVCFVMASSCAGAYIMKRIRELC